MLKPWRLQYASGLFADQGWRRAATALQPGAAPYLALLGNCGSVATVAQAKQTQEFLRSCSSSWNKVFWVLGPHEFSANLKTNEVYTAVEDRIRDIAGRFKNVYILNQGEHQTCDSVVLLGATGWSDAKATIQAGVTLAGAYGTVFVIPKAFGTPVTTLSTALSIQFIPVCGTGFKSHLS